MSLHVTRYYAIFYHYDQASEKIICTVISFPDINIVEINHLTSKKTDAG